MKRIEHATKDYTKDYIIVEDGCLYYVAKTMQEKKKSLPQFFSFVQKNLETSDRTRHSKSINVSRLRTFTFLVRNNGANDITCRYEASPDGIKWDSHGDIEHTVEPGNSLAIAPQYLLKFARVVFKNKNSGFNSNITVWIQGQD